jgi:hypothetical protein
MTGDTEHVETSKEKRVGSLSDLTDKKNCAPTLRLPPAEKD